MTQQASARRSSAAAGIARPSAALVVWVAGGLLGLQLALAVVLSILTRDPWPSDDGLVIGVAVVFAVEGLVIAKRQPRNPIGWALLFVGILVLGDTCAKLWLVLDYRLRQGQLPLGIATVHWRIGYVLMPLLFGLPVVLLFPDGQLSPRWRRLLRIYLVVAASFSLAQFVGQGLPAANRIIVNLRGVPTNITTSTVAGAAWLASPFFLGCWVAFAVHQIGRWRHANGVQRAQLKWLAVGASMCVISSVSIVAGGDPTTGTGRAIADVSTLGIAALPLSIGIGILRYRLYEIDRLVSRTLSYALVTGLLVGIYIGMVTLTTRVLPFSSPLAVASATLVAAALFTPMRTRIQRQVDRRFNRARYDAETTVTAFSSGLRQTTDLDLVQRQLVDVIVRAVQPAHVTVWIRPRT
ncbi:MAG: hypothetical protein QOD07_1046 [Frankiaceae bacterium]|nr:hypothetical protein [Frankiaceae bacterium]